LGAELSVIKEIPEGDISSRSEVFLPRHSIQSLVEFPQKYSNLFNLLFASMLNGVLQEREEFEVGLLWRSQMLILLEQI